MCRQPKPGCGLSSTSRRMHSAAGRTPFGSTSAHRGSRAGEEFDRVMTREEIARHASPARRGVFARQGTSSAYPPHIPSLIGIQDLRYLDSTGLVRNRSIGDIMRYAITNQGLDTLAHYGDFQPAPGVTLFSGDEGTRYSDEQLYARWRRPSSGNAAAPRPIAPSWRKAQPRPISRGARAWSSTPIFPAARSAGYSKTCPAPGKWRARATCYSATWTRG